MSGITLTSAVRQNLMSLQSTASMLATVQGRLATGKKVNTALDNPTNFFTAAGLESRAGDINNLLDGVGNGVQILQAANSGITSLQKLVDTAKSIANQALQSNVGYVKSSVVATIPGATPANLLGTAASALNAQAVGTSALTPIDLRGTPAGHAALQGANTFTGVDLRGTAATHAAATTGAAMTPVDLTATLAPATATGNVDLTNGIADTGANLVFTVNSQTVTLTTGSGSGAGGNFVLADIQAALTAATVTGVTASLANGNLQLQTTATGASAEIVTTGMTALGITAGTVTGTDAATDMSFTVNGTNVTLAAGSTYTGAQVAAAINTQAGTAASVNATYNATTGLSITSTSTANTGTADSVVVAGAQALGYASASVTANGANAAPAAAMTFEVNGSVVTLAGGVNHTAASVATAITNSGAGVTATYSAATGLRIASTGTAGATDSLALTNFSGTTSAATLGLAAASATGTAAIPAAAVTFDINGEQVTLAAGTNYDATAIAAAINNQVGTSASVVATVANGILSVRSTAPTGVADTLSIDNFSGTHNAQSLGFATAAVAATGADSVGIAGKTLTISATAGGVPTEITFGTGLNEVNTLEKLNAALAANNLIATVNPSGELKITTTNDAASSTIGTFGGTATGAGEPFENVTATAPTADLVSQDSRANLVAQYNKVVEQILTTAQDASFNGVNLLNGDSLKLIFNETGKSTLNIQGVMFAPEGLGLAKLTAGTDFIDNKSSSSILDTLNAASSQLRSQASAFGSNLSVVQIRQEFAKSLINVLQTGAANLTLADTNEEAANSQALATRQSIAVSALSLANQSQQSVLQLLQ